MTRDYIVHDILNISLLAGEDLKAAQTTLREGKVIGVICYTDGTESNNNNIVNLALKTAGKGYIEEPVHVHNYKHPDNGYAGLRPVNFIAGKNIYAEITALKKVAAETNFQIVFVIDQTPEE